MANARSLDCQSIAVNDGKTEPKSLGVDRINTITVRVFHSKGGLNYYNYQQEPAGYFVGLTPVYRKIENGWQSDSCLLGQGYKIFLGPGDRFSAKTLKQYADSVTARQDFQDTLNRLCVEHNLTIEQKLAG